MGTEIGFEPLRGPAHAERGGKSRWIHLRSIGRENEIGNPLGGELAAVAVERARVAVEIFVRRELRRVHENADGDLVRALSCLAHEAEMAFMQRAHGGNQPDACAVSPPFS